MSEPTKIIRIRYPDTNPGLLADVTEDITRPALEGILKRVIAKKGKEKPIKGFDHFASESDAWDEIEATQGKQSNLVIIQGVTGTEENEKILFEEKVWLTNVDYTVPRIVNVSGKYLRYRVDFTFTVERVS